MSDKRTAEEIEAELAATRLALTNTVNELHYRIKPSTQINNAKESARAFVEKAKNGDSKAIAIIAGTAVGLAAVIALPFILRRK